MLDTITSTVFSNLLFIIILFWLIYKSVIFINEMIYDKFKRQTQNAIDREIKAYSLLESVCIKLNKAYSIIDTYMDKVDKERFTLHDSSEQSSMIQDQSEIEYTESNVQQKSELKEVLSKIEDATVKENMDKISKEISDRELKEEIIGTDNGIINSMLKLVF